MFGKHRETAFKEKNVTESNCEDFSLDEPEVDRIQTLLLIKESQSKKGKFLTEQD